MVSLCRIRNAEIVQINFESVLCGQAGIHQVPVFVVPLVQSTIVEHLQVVLNDKRYNVVFEAFLEENQSPDATVAVLKWVDAFKLIMKGNDFSQGMRCFRIIRAKQCFMQNSKRMRTCLRIAILSSFETCAVFAMKPFCVTKSGDSQFPL